MRELEIRVILRDFHEVILVAEAGSEHQLAAVRDKILCGICAALILADVGLLDQLILGKAELLDCGLDASHVRLGVALVLIADVDDADLQVFLRDACARSLGLGFLSLGLLGLGLLSLGLFCLGLSSSSGGLCSSGSCRSSRGSRSGRTAAACQQCACHGHCTHDT